jgi:hypothetical protein
MMLGLAFEDLVHCCSGAILLRSLTGNQLPGRARLEPLVELSELSRQTVDECLGHLYFPSKDMGITDSSKCSSWLVDQHGPGHRRIVKGPFSNPRRNASAE